MPRCNYALTTIAKEFNYALTVKNLQNDVPWATLIYLIAFKRFPRTG